MKHAAALGRHELENESLHRGARLLLCSVALLLCSRPQLVLAASAPPDSAACPDAARMQAAEKGLKLEELMSKSQIPGMSIAVVRHFRIACAKGYGVTKQGGHAAVTPATLFLAGSISKPVAAVGALLLVQEGKVSLDEDVNRKLRSWKVRENEFTRTRAVSLGLLLDHTGGFTGGDFFPGYAAGTPLPSLTQILEGEPPAVSAPMRVEFVPGSRWKYSGDGYLVVQQLLTDVSARSFPDFMRDAVFDKLGMHDSTYEEPLPAAKAASAAAGTLRDGTAVAGGWRVNPEMAAGGLWSTPSDLARLAIDLAQSARGEGGRVLSQATALDMLDARWRDGVINLFGPTGDPDAMGYGFFVGKGHRFGHIGGNVGYQATLLMFGDSGNGIVIMTNSDVGLNAGNPLLNRIAEVFGWNYVAPPLPF